ncbi:SDR family oxidoreductase [Bosea sp. (in: a-proteobacteria)]|uniref:SDR family oxidoreductase n=1 Tax=Bosea sp. (in: a-proteobacteria) TaxID=1871050 RepID=UPI0027368546|nr:SDR family oxidoreductase [Bosea sp. (in: a-proteobacteria)]MDP3257836.1 SDR family oxidoreductase [Bosea sp. (in: a-proteobacteria)]
MFSAEPPDRLEIVGTRATVVMDYDRIFLVGAEAEAERIRDHLEREGFRDFTLDRNPLGRIGDPVEVVGQIITFAAPAGSYMTGQIVYVDGGVTASQ